MEHASIISYWGRKSCDLSEILGGFMFSQAVRTVDAVSYLYKAHKVLLERS